MSDFLHLDGVLRTAYIRTYIKRSRIVADYAEDRLYACRKQSS